MKSNTFMPLDEHDNFGSSKILLEQDESIFDNCINHECSFFVLQGKSKIRIDNSKYFLLEPNDLIRVNKKQSYKLKCNNKGGTLILMCYNK